MDKGNGFVKEGAMKRIHARVTGMVQGVYFRASARDAARALGLSGWVKNMPDGSVELEAEGKEEVIDKMIDWLHEGPPYGSVDRVEVREIPVLGDASGFHIEF